MTAVRELVDPGAGTVLQVPKDTTRLRDRRILGTPVAAAAVEGAWAAASHTGKAIHIQGAVADLALAKRHSRAMVVVPAGQRVLMEEASGHWGIVRGPEDVVVRRRRNGLTSLEHRSQPAGLAEVLEAANSVAVGREDERLAPLPVLRFHSLDQSPTQYGGCRK